MNNRTDLLGVVLCGGESKRMGSDKGLLMLNGKTWAEHVAEKLESLNLHVIISINKTQLEAYSKIFNEEELVIDELPMHGPLNGLLTVHRHFDQKDILLIACDLVEMDNETLNVLKAAYEQNDADYFAYEENNFFQPLCAIYTSKALSLLDHQVKTGSLANYSFQHILNSGNTFKLHITLQKPFTNYNSNTDLAGKS